MLAVRAMSKRTVYVLRSEVDLNRYYVGLTSDVGQRLNWHNAGLSAHTASRRRLRIVVYFGFSRESVARAANQGSGKMIMGPV